MGRKYEMDLECWHVYYYMGKLISTNGNMMNPWFRRHVNCYICQWLIHNVVFFYQIFQGWYNQKTNKFEYSLNSIQYVFGTTWWGRD